MKTNVHLHLIIITFFCIVIYFIVLYYLDVSCQCDLQKRLETSETGYQRYVRKRQARIGPNPSKVNAWLGTVFFEYFQPAFNCPHSVQRIGQISDGGKWICGFEYFESGEPCIVYSFGVFGESSFEAEFLANTKCEIFAFDASVEKMGPDVINGINRIHFNKIFIGNETKGNMTTLGAIMKQYGHTWIDVLKVDIEWAEFSVMDQITQEFEILPFGQLQLEIHGDNAGKSFPDVYKMWVQLENKGLRAFRNEMNPGQCVSAHEKPYVYEYSFINIKGNHRIIS